MHQMKRNEVELMKCLMCKCIQPKNDKCTNPDCEKKTETKYHPVYHKCSLCESWNTTIDKINK